MFKKIKQKLNIKTIVLALILLTAVPVIGQAGGSLLALAQPNQANAISPWRWTRPPAVFLEQTSNNENNPRWIIRITGMDQAEKIRFTMRDLNGNSLFGWKEVTNKDLISYYEPVPINSYDYAYRPLGRIIWLEVTHPTEGADYIQYRTIIGKGTKNYVTRNYITDVSTAQSDQEWSITVPSIPKQDDEDKSPAPFEVLSKVNRVYSLWVRNNGTRDSGASFVFNESTFNNSKNNFKVSAFRDQSTLNKRYTGIKLGSNNNYSVIHRGDYSEYYVLAITNK